MLHIIREKRRDLTQSYYKIPIPSENETIESDLGLSVEVANAIQLVWFNQFKGSQPYN